MNPSKPVAGRNVVVRALLALSTLALFAGPVRAQDGPPPAPIRVAKVEMRDVARQRSFVGTVMPRRESVVGAETDGLVIAYPAEEGTRVKKGDVLAQQRTDTYAHTVTAARAELDLRRSELAELEAGTREEELEQARARLAAATANRERRDWQLASTDELFRTQQMSETELRDATGLALTARALESEAKARLAELEAGPRKEQIEQARARMNAQKARVGALEDALARHTIRAPFDGYVVSEHTEVGHWLSKGDPVARVVALDEVDVVVPVVEDFVGGLALGGAAAVRVDAAGKEPFEGTVAAVVPSADARTRTFPVKVRVKNRTSPTGVLLKAGMFAEVTLSSRDVTKHNVVPKDALVLGGPTPMVWAILPDEGGAGDTGTVRPVPVGLGPSTGAFIAVTGELGTGALVAVLGNERLRPGQRVTFDAKGAK